MGSFLDALPGVGSIVSGIGGIASSIGNVRAQKLANKANLQIAQMNNEWNAQQSAISRDWQEQMMNKQNQWNLDQWNRENEYNSAASQRARFEAAGLNGALMMQGQSAGNAGQVTSASAGESPTPSAQQVTMQAPRFDFSSISQAINSYFTNRNLAESTEAASRQNSTMSGIIQNFPQEYTNAVLSRLSGRDVTELNPERVNAINRVAPLTVNTGLMRALKELDNMNKQGELMSTQAILLKLDSQAKQIINKYLEPQQQIELYLKLGETFNAFTSGELNRKKMDTEVWRAINEQWSAKGTQLDVNMKRSLYQSTIAAIHAEYEYKRTYYNAKRGFARDIAAGEGHSAQAQSIYGQLLRGYLNDWNSSPNKRFLWKTGKFVGDIFNALPVMPLLNMAK